MKGIHPTKKAEHSYGMLVVVI